MSASKSPTTVLVTGGAGYVGAVLVPLLLQKGYHVKVVDLLMYGDVLVPHPRLQVIKGDIRDQALLKKSMPGVDTVIHLACISNDPSFDLNPELGKSINLDAFRPMVEIAKEAGVSRFIYASSSSVYGVKDVEGVDEEMSLEPLTDYSKFKAECERILAEYDDTDFVTVTVRPATVCGYSPRQRLDLVVNILTNYAFNKRKITVFGGDQKRPNVHIQDMCELYMRLMEAPEEKIRGKIYNFGFENHTVSHLAKLVKKVVGEDVGIEVAASDDPRSYHISSGKIQRELGFAPRFTIEDAIADLKRAFEGGSLPRSFEDARYFNIKTMKEIELR